MSWGVRRIEDESTDPNFGGGRRSAMTVGEWLDSVSTGPRDRVGPVPGPSRYEVVPANPLDALDQKLEELNNRLKKLSAKADPQPAQRRSGREFWTQPRSQGRDRSFDSQSNAIESQLSARLDQIDRRLAELGGTARNSGADSLRRQHSDRRDKGSSSDAERMKQGLREIQKLQAALLQGLNERSARSESRFEKSTHDAFNRSDRNSAEVAEMIARLESEVRGLRHTVENRLEPTPPPFDDSAIQEMRRMLQQLADGNTERPETIQLDRLFDEMNRLRELVVETGTKAVGATSAKSQHDTRLADMVERLAAVATSAQEKTSGDLRTLERRLGEIGDRMADLERRGANADDLVELQRAINAIAAKLDRPAPPAPKPVIPAGLIDLDIRIEKLSEKLDRYDPHPANTRQLTALETEIAALRLDLAQANTARSNLGGLESQLQELGTRIDRFANGVQSSNPRAVLERFEAKIGDLVETIDRMARSDVSVDRQIDALQGEIRDLRRDLAVLGDQSRNPELEAQIRQIAGRLESVGQQIGDPRVLAKIDDKINRLGDLIAADKRAVPDTAGIEAKLRKLEALLEDRHEDALQAASHAAREAVREFASFAADTRQSDAGVRALEEDLRKVRDANHSTEIRTSDALQSVHDALSTIVNRLASIEQAGLGRASDPGPDKTSDDRISVDKRPTGQTNAGRSAPDDQPTQPGAHNQLGGSASVRPPEAALRPEDNRPLEPGSGKPRVLPPQSAATASTRIGQPAPAPRMAETPVAASQGAPASTNPAGTSRNEFIAAARRAALAASQASTSPPPVPSNPQSPQFTAEATVEPKEKKSFFGSFLKRKQKTLAVAGVGIGLATAASILVANLVRTTSFDQLPTASIAKQTATAVQPNAAMPTPAAIPDPSASAIALAPPTSVTSTFSPPQSQQPAQMSDDAKRQAALADAMKLVASTQGIKPQATNTTTQGEPAPTPAPSAGPQVAVQQSVQPAPQASSEPALPLPTDKIGSLALRTAAANGDPKAQFEVGMRFFEGRGVTPDQQQSAVWFQRSAAHGFQPAAYRLGSAYEKGLGLDRNVAEAKRWYHQAAEGGNVRAMHNLGVLYANERDMASGLTWFQKAGDAGLKDSQFNLGIIYALGSGVKQDLAISYKWFALAGAQGDQEAVKKRDDIASRLDRTQLATAKLAVSTWRPAQISREANEETAVWAEPAAMSSASPSQAPNGFNKIMQAQAALQGKGLYSGTIDGELTPETRAAIKTFQKKVGLRPTGDIDPATMSAVVAKQM